MLTLDQIEPGIVAWLDADALNADARVGDTGAIGVRPFICVDVGPGCTAWLACTSRDRPLRCLRRLPVPEDARFDGTAGWRTGPCFVRDIRHLVSGRDVAFVDASASHMARVGRGGRVVSGQPAPTDIRKCCTK